MDRRPKAGAFRDAAKRSLTIGGLGSIGEKAANALSDFVLVDMFASFCTGREDAKGAMKSVSCNVFIVKALKRLPGREATVDFVWNWPKQEWPGPIRAQPELAGHAGHASHPPCPSHVYPYSRKMSAGTPHPANLVASSTPSHSEESRRPGSIL